MYTTQRSMTVVPKRNISIVAVVSRRESDQRMPGIKALFEGKMHAYNVDANNARQLLGLVAMQDDYMVDSWTGCIDYYLGLSSNYTKDRPYSLKEVGYVRLCNTKIESCEEVICDENCIAHEMTCRVHADFEDFEYWYRRGALDAEMIDNEAYQTYCIEAPTLNMMLDLLERYLQHRWVLCDNPEFQCGFVHASKLWNIRVKRMI